MRWTAPLRVGGGLLRGRLIAAGLSRQNSRVIAEGVIGPVSGGRLDGSLDCAEQAGQFRAIMVLARGQIMRQDLAGHRICRQMQRANARATRNLRHDQPGAAQRSSNAGS
jgi:hypothetical protein